MKKQLETTWNLDNIFPGGSESDELQAFLDTIEQDIQRLEERLKADNFASAGERQVQPLVELIQDISARLIEAESFAVCLTSQDQTDQKAVQISGKIKSLNAGFASASIHFDQLLTQIPDNRWEVMLESDVIWQISFVLNERRTRALDRMLPELEALAADAAVDGYHGWSELYDAAVGRLRIPFEENGKLLLLSAGQADNKLHSPERRLRENVFERWQNAWSEQAELCALSLNHLAGFRLQLYKHRGWDSVLKEPLEINRMSEKTLQTMWEVIDRNKEVFLRYLQRKASLLGVDSLSWHDVEAPLGEGGKEISFDRAAGMIVEQFGKFSPQMADFAEMAFERRWIEAEDRPGKRPGGFCTSFPVSGESRIFMTYGQTLDNVGTLAHELGHAYHQHLMNGLPEMLQNYAMNVAETASTFAEMIVVDASLKMADNVQERIFLLEDKIQRAVTFFMNIQARFLFEVQFYKERKSGLVSVDRLNEIMTEAQQKAFRHSLGSYHPYFWASKLHFYATDVPFYNFPYTFGYLFSTGLYARALEEGPGFADKYAALLRDTGAMPVEELARKHLGADLTRDDFWQAAIELLIKDVNEFLSLTKTRE
ncbi:M3 family oligoendopeptidase [Ferviditalea candida]|uniref:M3 family oligoendopeptidase n=1 Tax=Ferviditalea candida TaxID=3108399 RepID=A0ABU5ZCV6_9BACL|nr:M3 family oligoendopeptidase [Paenibacillaceae bacterium T2]